MLARWALLPLIPYIAAHVFHGWPELKPRFNTPNDAVPVFVLQVAGGLLASLLLAWIAYRISGRSQSVGSIVFSAFILLFSANVFLEVCGFYVVIDKGSQNQQQSRRIIAVPPKPPTDFPEFGFHADAPAGWKHAIPHDKQYVTGWASPDSTNDKLRALITIQREPAGSKTLRDRADECAKAWNGRVDQQHLFIDAEPALRVYAFAPESDLKPVEALITLHDNYFFVIIGIISPGQTCHDQMESVAESWRWISAN